MCKSEGAEFLMLAIGDDHSRREAKRRAFDQSCHMIEETGKIKRSVSPIEKIVCIKSQFHGSALFDLYNATFRPNRNIKQT